PTDPVIVLVGPGRAGRAFARSWSAAGGRILLAGRDADATRKFAAELSAPALDLAGGGTLEGDVLALSVSDDAISHVATLLAPRGRWRFALHFSGALGSDVLTPLHSAGATVRLHKAALADRPDLAALYALLARETLARTFGRGRESEIGEIVGSAESAGPRDPAGTGKKLDSRGPRG